MARPPRHNLPSAAHFGRLPKHPLLRACAAFFLATLVALPLAVLHRAALSRHTLEHSWGWDALPSVAAQEEDAAQGEDLGCKLKQTELICGKEQTESRTLLCRRKKWLGVAARRIEQAAVDEDEDVTVD